MPCVVTQIPKFGKKLLPLLPPYAVYKEKFWGDATSCSGETSTFRKNHLPLFLDCTLNTKKASHFRNVTAYQITPYILEETQRKNHQ